MEHSRHRSAKRSAAAAPSLMEVLAACTPALERLGGPERAALRACCRAGRACVDAAVTQLRLALSNLPEEVGGILMTRAGLKAIAGMASRGCAPTALRLTLSETTPPRATKSLEDVLQLCGASVRRLELAGPRAGGSAPLVEALAAALPALRELSMECMEPRAAASGSAGPSRRAGAGGSASAGQAATEAAGVLVALGPRLRSLRVNAQDTAAWPALVTALASCNGGGMQELFLYGYMRGHSDDLPRALLAAIGSRFPNLTRLSIAGPGLLQGLLPNDLATLQQLSGLNSLQALRMDMPAIYLWGDEAMAAQQRRTVAVLAATAPLRQLRSLELGQLKLTYDNLRTLAMQHPDLTRLAVGDVVWPAEDTSGAAAAAGAGSAAADDLYPPNTAPVPLPPRLRLLRLNTCNVLLRHLAALAPPGADTSGPAPAGGRLSLQLGDPGRDALLKVALSSSSDFRRLCGEDAPCFDPQRMAEHMRALVWLLADQMAPRAAGSGGGGAFLPAGASLISAVDGAGDSDGFGAAGASGVGVRPHTGLVLSQDRGDPGEPLFLLLRELAPIGCLGGGLLRLDCHSLDFDADELGVLAATCPSLKELHLHRCSFAAADLRELVPLPHLELLEIDDLDLDLWLAEEGSEEGLTRLSVEGASAVARSKQRTFRFRHSDFETRCLAEGGAHDDSDDETERLYTDAFKRTRWGSEGRPAVVGLFGRMLHAAEAEGRSLTIELHHFFDGYYKGLAPTF